MDYSKNIHASVTVKTILIVSFIALLVACSKSRQDSTFGLTSTDYERAEEEYKNAGDKSKQEEANEETKVYGDVASNAWGFGDGDVTLNFTGGTDPYTYAWTVADGNGTVNLAEPNSNQFISSSAAVENSKDTVHKFIRTADIRFRVNEVAQATYTIEDIIKHFGGWVTETRLTSNIDNVRLIPVSKDSSLETTYYTVENTMTLRVPNTNLDTTLKTIAKQIDYLNYRVIRATDVSLQMYSKFLEQKRLRDYDERMKKAIDTRGTKLKETSTAEDDILNRQEQADNAKISTLSLQDQINFSTISLEIYQRQSIKRELIGNNKNIEAYKPSFMSRLKESFKSGWRIAEEFVIFITNLWVVILFLAVVAFVLYKVLRRAKK